MASQIVRKVTVGNGVVHVTTDRDDPRTPLELRIVNEPSSEEAGLWLTAEEAVELMEDIALALAVAPAPYDEDEDEDA